MGGLEKWRMPSGKNWRQSSVLSGLRGSWYIRFCHSWRAKSKIGYRRASFLTAATKPPLRGLSWQQNWGLTSKTRVSIGKHGQVLGTYTTWFSRHGWTFRLFLSTLWTSSLSQSTEKKRWPLSRIFSSAGSLKPKGWKVFSGKRTRNGRILGCLNIGSPRYSNGESCHVMPNFSIVIWRPLLHFHPFFCRIFRSSHETKHTALRPEEVRELSWFIWLSLP